MRDVEFMRLFMWLLLLGAYSFERSNCETHPGDTKALKGIKAFVESSSKLLPGSCISSWNFSHDPCDSATFACGFTCDQASPHSRRVVTLELDDASYTGAVPPSVGGLPALVVLDLSHNSFTGKIPSAISKLKSLRTLDLSANKLSGPIPESLHQLVELEYLSLADNRLSGPIPVSLFASMHKLQRLYVENNRLLGALPSSLSKSTSLRYLDASNNGLTDNSVLSKLPSSLFQLSLRGNSLTGKLDVPELSNFQELGVLDLSQNKITGVIPSTLFKLPGLEQVNLSKNQLTSIRLDGGLNLKGSQLVAFDASHNRITGRLPLEFTKFSRLSSLSLSNNLLADTIPEDYAEKVAQSGTHEVLPFTRLLLDGNYLKGELPHTFLKPLPNLITASFTFNCLDKCPAALSFCQGRQRPHSECSHE